METLKHSLNIEKHYRYLSIFKKVIEKAIELELNEANENKQTYGYLVSGSTDYDHFFQSNSTFVKLMFDKKIILKSKLQKHQIFFPMFILATIINDDLIDIDKDVLMYPFLNNLDFENDDDDDIKILNKMIESPGEFWIINSGINEENENFNFNIIFDFGESNIEQYIYEKNKYWITRKYENKIGEKFTKIEVLNEEKNFEVKELFFYQMKEVSKFEFQKIKVKEYIFQDILDYINNQINVYHSLDKIIELNKELNSEIKSPKMVQKLLDNDLSIDEALESIGY